MSHMQSSYENANVQMYQEPERTSVMAILSLVFGFLGCCVFVTAPIGVLLGILGLFGISRSKGRVGGTGFAIGGVVVSILAMAIWLGIVFGIGGAMKAGITQFGATTEGILTDIQKADYDAARARMIPPASEVGDAEIAGFHAAYSADLGEYVGLPNSLGELFSGYAAVGQQIQSYNGRPGYVPMPVRFDSGWVLVIYVMDPNGQGGGAGQMPPPKMLLVIGADGREYSLPADAGDAQSVNRPGSEVSGDSSPEAGQEDQAPTGNPADEPDVNNPEGP